LLNALNISIFGCIGIRKTITMKTKVAFSLLLVLFLGSTVLPQTYVFQVRLEDPKKWGYANFSGKIFIQPKFKTNYQFTEEESTLILDHQRFAIIDKGGNWVVAPFIMK
jgi:hypothetical protein